jgi:branched-chain amino acid transport system permease protein
MVAVAFTLTIGMLNFLNFTIPALFMVAAMITWAVSASGYHWLVGAALGMAAAIAASLVIERFTYRYLKTRYGDATEHALPLVSSLGFLIILEHVVIMAWGTDPMSFTSPFQHAQFRIGGIIFGIPQLISLFLSIALVFCLSTMLKRTRLGRALRCIAEKPDTVVLMGVDVGRIVPVVFMITGFLCALAGILFTINYKNVSPYIGDHVATIAIAGMVIGGLGNIWGAIAGGLIIGMVEVLSIHFWGADIVKVPVWGLMLLLMIFRPTGLFGHTMIGKGKF